MGRRATSKLPLGLHLTGRVFVPHFLTQTSFYCCQQHGNNIAAEEKNCVASCLLRAVPPRWRERCGSSSVEAGGNGQYAPSAHRVPASFFFFLAVLFSPSHLTQLAEGRVQLFFGLGEMSTQAAEAELAFEVCAGRAGAEVEN